MCLPKLIAARMARFLSASCHHCLGGGVFGLISASARFIVLSSLLWVNSIVGLTMAPISPTYTSFIVSSFLICPERSGMMAELVGEFPVNLKYYDFLSLPPKLVAYVKCSAHFISPQYYTPEGILCRDEMKPPMIPCNLYKLPVGIF